MNSMCPLAQARTAGRDFLCCFLPVLSIFSKLLNYLVLSTVKMMKSNGKDMSDFNDYGNFIFFTSKHFKNSAGLGLVSGLTYEKVAPTFSNTGNEKEKEKRCK